MTIANALTFINRGLVDSTLRSRLNTASSPMEVENTLSKERLLFSADDFDEAFHLRLTLCKEMEEADQLREFKMWWDLLIGILGPTACGNPCSSCCE